MNPLFPEPFETLLQRNGEEYTALLAYPEILLADIIQMIGFSCDRCAQCCTRAFNGHVFLLDDEAGRIRDTHPDALEPSFPWNFCDQHGTFYVSGYTLRSLEDPEQSCIFLEENRCLIYSQRPSVCRIYPSMLHREPDENGKVDWRQISGLNQHGYYHNPVARADAIRLARKTKRFEAAVLEQERAFLQYTGKYFSVKGLRHVRKTYDDRVRQYSRGRSVMVHVFHAGKFEPCEVWTRNQT